MRRIILAAAFLAFSGTPDAEAESNRDVCRKKMNFWQARTCYQRICVYRPDIIYYQDAAVKKWCARMRKEAKRRGVKLSH